MGKLQGEVFPHVRTAESFPGLLGAKILANSTSTPGEVNLELRLKESSTMFMPGVPD